RLSFDTKSGALTKISNGNVNGMAGALRSGLELWQGTARKPLTNPKIVSGIKDNAGMLTFEQVWPGDLTVSNKISAGNNGEIFWDIGVLNKGKQKQQLEALLGLPVGLSAKDFFVMSWVQTKLD